MVLKPSAATVDKHFHLFTNGQVPVTRENSRIFLGTICHKSASDVLEALVTEPRALDALQRALFVETGASRLNNMTAQVVAQLRDPTLRVIGGGVPLSKVVAKIIHPPDLLLAYKDALFDGELDEDGQNAFAWLLLQRCSLSHERCDVVDSCVPACLDELLDSRYSDVRNIAEDLQDVLSGTAPDDNGPGWRHDNDHADIRSISILPTAEELASDIPPYLLTPLELEDVPADYRPKAFIDNQFRLLREDMIHAIREEIEAMKAGKRPRGLSFDIRRPVGIFGVVHEERDDGRIRTYVHKWALELQCSRELPCLRNIHSYDEREQYLAKERDILRQQSSICLLVDGTPIAFPAIHRDVERLARNPAVLCLRFNDGRTAVQALAALKSGSNVQIVQLESPIFAYEPVLSSLQRMRMPALTPELFLWSEDSFLEQPPIRADHVIGCLQDDPSHDIGALLGLGRRIVLDTAQRTALVSALSQRVALIQGPPGCGKSFVGALIAKILHDETRQKILVTCFTNHALDQFIEDLLDNGIPGISIVRLGGKSTARTAPLSLYKQGRRRFGQSDWHEIESLQLKAESLYSIIGERYRAFYSGVLDEDLLAYLKSTKALTGYADALTLPSDLVDDDMIMVGADGRAIGAGYLIARWKAGKDAGVFVRDTRFCTGVWRMSPDQRLERLHEWRDSLLHERASQFMLCSKRYNAAQAELASKWAEGKREVILSKRIIACTTTGAAKYTEWLREASPKVLLVEEAGEILESHILTALGAKTEHMILIGDHQQLRPKIQNYSLAVESRAGGYEFNVSLFERLVLSGYPHHSLKEQHRMRPEIASYPRRLTYPNLTDAPNTSGRPDLLGVRDNIVFISHENLEDDAEEDGEAGQGLLSSKQNTYEAEMTLKTVRYVLQQGYDTEDLVVLTPYLGQLKKLREMMSQEDYSASISDLDYGDLQRSGMAFDVAAVPAKKSIRIATIDNYQGEESKIVIASFVRSNTSHNIGFMSSPERLNVLLSRARDALIMIGNPETFMKSRAGKALYSRFFSLLKDDGHIYEGLPIQCPRHSDQKATVSAPSHFEQYAPQGGCQKPCNELLTCGLHLCPLKCHHFDDHSKVKCQQTMADTCSEGHRRSWRCFAGTPSFCSHCEHAAKLAQERKERLEAEEREFNLRMTELDLEIENLRL